MSTQRLYRLAIFAVLVFIVAFALTESYLVQQVSETVIDYVQPMLVIPSVNGGLSACL